MIQEANLRALSGGATTDRIFDLVREVRKTVTTPMVFMAYANVVFSYGSEKFISQCAEAGIDGLTLLDVPFEEQGEFLVHCQRYGVDFIPLIAPASENRIAMIAKEAQGFAYVVSSPGSTGVRSGIATDIGAMVKIIRENTKIPCVVGFGISTPEQAEAMSKNAEGVIVGSAVVKLAAKFGRQAANPIGEYVRSMKQAVNQQN